MSGNTFGYSIKLYEVKAMDLAAEVDGLNAEIERLRAGFMACLQDKNECDAWLYGSACRTAETCRCALELELWCNRAVSKEDT